MIIIGFNQYSNCKIPAMRTEHLSWNSLKECLLMSSSLKFISAAKSIKSHKWVNSSSASPARWCWWRWWPWGGDDLLEIKILILISWRLICAWHFGWQCWLLWFSSWWSKYTMIYNDIQLYIIICNDIYIIHAMIGKLILGLFASKSLFPLNLRFVEKYVANPTNPLHRR